MAHCQLLGAFSSELATTMATVLLNLGSTHAFVVHGADHLDEITISAETDVAEVFAGSVNV